MNKRLLILRDELGGAGMASIVLFACALLFLLFSLRPLEARNARLEAELAQSQSRNTGVSAATPAARLAAFYRFFETEKQTTDWLADLHAAAQSAGIQMRSASYQFHDTGTPLERYEISLPITGSYAQIRAFLESALAQIPVLAIDQVNFRRNAATDAQIQAEVRLSLHRRKK